MPDNPIICSPMSLVDYIKFCCTGDLPAHVKKALSDAAKDPVLKAILCRDEIIGNLEPLAATRPGVCDPVIYYERQVTVPPATTDPEGNIIPAEVRVISYCAPMNRVLVVETSRVTAANTIAAQQPHTQPVYKKVNLGTFGEWCLPFEPLDAPGAFSNVEHIIVPAGGGYSVYVQNWNTTAEAIYDFQSRFWASC